MAGGKTVSSAGKLVVYGASGHARAVASNVHNSPTAFGLRRIVAFVEDGAPPGRELIRIPVVDFEEWRTRYRTVPCCIAVAHPAARRALAERIGGIGGRFDTLYEDPGLASRGVNVGEGTWIAQFVYFAHGVDLGAHVHVMPMCSIGHDVEIGDFVTICPSVTVSGYVSVGDEAFIGAGAVILNGRPGHPLSIGRGATVAAGAVVTKSVPEGMTVAGNPARPLRELALSRRRR